MCVATINPLKADLNPIRHLLAFVEAHHTVHVNRVRVNYVNDVAHLVSIL
jgi:hypothetical protein